MCVCVSVCVGGGGGGGGVEVLHTMSEPKAIFYKIYSEVEYIVKL